MDMTIWVDSWQMQCCGEPFHRGSQVAWTLRPADADWLEEMLSPHAQQTVDAAEEHHGGVPEDTPATLGTVTGIAVHCRFEALPDSGAASFYPVQGSGGIDRRRIRGRVDGPSRRRAIRWLPGTTRCLTSGADVVGGVLLTQ